MKVDPNEKIGGISIIDVRKFLRRSGDFASWNWQLPVRLLRISEDDATKLLGELVRRNLIEEVDGRDGERWFGNTLSGNSLALASAAKPILRKTADRLLAEMIKRVHKVNSDPHFLYKVTEVRIFGSYLSGGQRLNDVDVAIQLIRKEADGETYMELGEKRVREATSKGRNFRSYFDELLWPMREVYLFLRNRSRALNIHRLEELAGLVTESHLIFAEEQSANGDAQ